jgi:hypothetical protein
VVVMVNVNHPIPSIVNHHSIPSVVDHDIAIIHDNAVASTHHRSRRPHDDV